MSYINSGKIRLMNNFWVSQRLTLENYLVMQLVAMTRPTLSQKYRDAGKPFQKRGLSPGKVALGSRSPGSPSSPLRSLLREPLPWPAS